jgi:hypothetical protein
MPRFFIVIPDNFLFAEQQRRERKLIRNPVWFSPKKENRIPGSRFARPGMTM